MKEELQSKLIEILGSIQTAAGKAGDFALVQLPEIAQSYVIYGRAMSLVKIGFAVAALLVAFFIFRGIRKHCVGKDELMDCDPAVVVFGGFGMFALSAAGFLMLYQGIASAALVWFAPKVWLLKEIAGLIK